eukprot:7605415-Alexandrium_andersonii.AAC.1
MSRRSSSLRGACTSKPADCLMLTLLMYGSKQLSTTTKSLRVPTFDEWAWHVTSGESHCVSKGMAATSCMAPDTTSSCTHGTHSRLQLKSPAMMVGMLTWACNSPSKA